MLRKMITENSMINIMLTTFKSVDIKFTSDEKSKLF